ncbi:uncharacterized protein TNIN_239211 [Trichonephila inaurata madagascariensis]|uniref:PiggyBac transposable element-derived protein domain-containing protein n=1 Tax=Trichonephila inaurata madagascariensis TaxID=2747483 RepID=A0A8X6Y803_9ARAC|nr:uncharacterized protein TNIN_239211 [Trichonephila inaurata madagascariensis]
MGFAYSFFFALVNSILVVTFISTCVASDPIEKIQRYCKDSRKKVEVQCPQIVRPYNRHMGGVDLADMLISLYKIPFKSRRWCLGIFAQIVDICLNNAWLVYRDRHGPGSKISLKCVFKKPDIKNEVVNEIVSEVVNEINSSSEMLKTVKINSYDFDALIDTGSTITLTRESVYQIIGRPTLNPTKIKLTSFGKSEIKPFGSFKFTIDIEDN